MLRIQGGDGTEILVGVADVVEEEVTSDEVVEQELVLFVEDVRCFVVNLLVHSQYRHALAQDRVQAGVVAIFIIAVLIPDLADKFVLTDMADIKTMRPDENFGVDALPWRQWQSCQQSAGLHGRVGCVWIAIYS